ncbi:MAG: ParB/RepB/Spo0J family partition protein [Anaerolineae bacterium]|nr:ParB/RepB/Spo0J family partition protein [Anaerolineae bacterium]
MPRRDLLAEIDFDAGANTDSELRPTRSRTPTGRAILDLAVSDIISESPLQTRQVTFDPGRFPEDAELLESVRRFGVIEPVLVQPLPGDLGESVRYRLVFGNRRVAAAHLAGRATVPALLATASETADRLTIAENSGRRELSPYEKALVLVQLKAQHADMEALELADATGWPRPTVYALLAAYEKSVPVLRRVFAEGAVAPRTIQAMQPLFERTPEEQHEALARQLAGRTHEEIERLRVAAQSGRSPLEELRLTPPTRTRDPRPETEPSPKKAGRPLGSPNKAKPDPPALDSGDGTRVREIAEATGAVQAAVQRLMQQAIARNVPYPVVFAACLYVGRGGAEEDALHLSQAAFRHAKAGAHLRRLIQYHTYLRVVRQWTIHLPNENLRGFVQTILGSGTR